MIYLYGLMHPRVPDPAAMLESIDGVTGPVARHPMEAGHLIFGSHDGSKIMAKRRFLLAHARVLEEASKHGTVLPMRFGMMAEDVAAVEELVAVQSDVIAGHFNRLDGLLEYGIRVAFPGEAALANELERHPGLTAERDQLARGSGHFQKAEFGRKLGEALERHRTDLQHKLIAVLKEEVVDLVVRAPENEFQVLNAHALIRADAEHAFPARLETLAGTLDFAPGAEPAIELVGPAPLYNFVSLNLASVPKQAA
ncbi:MAG: GvpL/GvpF family gas vesicle protein [Pseudomonadota bacterium]